MFDATLRSRLLTLYPILSKVPAVYLDRALENAQVMRVAAGTLMWEETQKIQTFPFVLKGVARIIKLAPSGRELHLYNVGPGDGCVIATSSMVGDTLSNARAIADQDMEMVSLPIPVFKTLVAQSEAFRDYVFCDLSGNLSQLTQLVTAIAFQNLDQRLAAVLVSKGNPIQTTHQALADDLGSVREIVSRLLKNFVDKGWVSLERGQITVLNAQELSDFSKQV
jgi:CRP/FNR family transcriptional regulator